MNTRHNDRIAADAKCIADASLRISSATLPTTKGSRAALQKIAARLETARRTIDDIAEELSALAPAPSED